MGSVINIAGRLSDEQRGLIRQGALERRDWKTVHAAVSEIRPVTQALVRGLMEECAAELSVKAEAKKEGSRLIAAFLKDAKDGADVEDMAALLEQALYRDILRRYADAGDPLVSMTMEQLLKLDIAYRSARLARRRHESAGSKHDLDKEEKEIERMRRLYEERRNNSHKKERAYETASGVAR